MPKKRDKRILIISDTHCGSRVGLTPPKWQYKPRQLGDKYIKYQKVQQELWQFYLDTIKNLQPIDILVHCGDAIDGKGTRSGGTELINTDRYIQTEMAAEVISAVKAKTVILLYGTAYHASADEDWEDVLKTKILEINGAERVFVEGHAFPNINGVQFDIKHKIGSSSIPHGRFTAVARDRLWNTIWHITKERQPKAGVMIRAHIHYFAYCGGIDWLALTMPAMCGYGSKYGIRECSGVVDIGMVYFDISPEGNYIWQPLIAELPQQKVSPLKL